MAGITSPVNLLTCSIFLNEDEIFIDMITLLLSANQYEKRPLIQLIHTILEVNKELHIPMSNDKLRKKFTQKI